jgi:hypothetical protein
VYVCVCVVLRQKRAASLRCLCLAVFSVFFFPPWFLDLLP